MEDLLKDLKPNSMIKDQVVGQAGEVNVPMTSPFLVQVVASFLALL